MVDKLNYTSFQFTNLRVFVPSCETSSSASRSTARPSRSAGTQERPWWSSC